MFLQRRLSLLLELKVIQRCGDLGGPLEECFNLPLQLRKLSFSPVPFVQ